MLAGVDAIATIAREEKDARGSTMSTTNPTPNAAAAPAVESEPAARPSRKGIIFGGLGGLLALAGGAAGVSSYRRRRPRQCPNGHGSMVRLDEVADDAHLDPGQRVEEDLKSVDYDVWVCPTCQQVLIQPRRAWFTRYMTCKSCNRRTLETESRTVTHATTSHTGTEEVTERCRNCSFTRTYRRTIPRVQASSGSSSGGSSSSGGGSSSSFGGGSSGGGGAGGNY
jgi:uncharacterized protein